MKIESDSRRNEETGKHEKSRKKRINDDQRKVEKDAGRREGEKEAALAYTTKISRDCKNVFIMYTSCWLCVYQGFVSLPADPRETLCRDSGHRTLHPKRR